MERRLIRADEVATMIGVNPKLAAELMKQMPRINIGRSLQRPRWAVYSTDVQAWLNSRQIPAEVPGQPRQQRRRTQTSSTVGLLDENGHIPRRK